MLSRDEDADYSGMAGHIGYLNEMIYKQSLKRRRKDALG